MGRRTQSIISSLLMITSIVLLVAVGFLYLRNRDDTEEPTPPTPVPGHNQAINVLEAFRSENLDASFGEQGTDVRSAILERPGQKVELDSGAAYIFIYPDVASQEQATLDVVPEDIDLTDISGDPVDVDTIDLFTGSNVAVVLVDSDQETADRVQSAVAELT
jgi:hypothetical protein